MQARLEDLPVDLWGNQIPLNSEVISALEQTNSHFVFFNNNPVKQALKLMDFIFYDKDVNAHALIDLNPQIIFLTVNVITRDNTIERMNAFEYALKLSSVHFINMFIKKMAIETENPALDNEINIISMQEYSDAVKNYKNAYDLYLTNEMNQQQIDGEMLKVGKQQKNLPIWMLKKLLQKHDNEIVPGDTGKAYNYKDEKDSIDITSFSGWSRLGEDITLVRGPYHNNRQTTKGYYTTEAVVAGSVRKDLESILKFQTDAQVEIKNILSTLRAKYPTVSPSNT